MDKTSSLTRSLKSTTGGGRRKTMSKFGLLKSKKTLVAIFVLALAVVGFSVAQAATGFGPSRQTYKAANPPKKVTFNSIIDNNVVGDERSFYWGRDINAGTNSYTNHVTVMDGQTLTLQVFFHNNGKNEKFKAINTRVKMILPQGKAKMHESTAYISADNADPGTVWTTMDFVGERPFALEYVPGSARIRTNWLNDVKLSDSIISNSGALIGSKALDGVVPGCDKFSGWININVKVKMPQPTPEKEVKKVTKVVKVTELPKTGAGSVAGVFAGASALAGVGHYLVTRRRG
jgi:LPXTG-motif cell wall-anchored protein